MPKKPAPSTPTEESPKAKSSRSRLLVPLASLAVVGMLVYFAIFKLPAWQEWWAFKRVRDQGGDVELRVRGSRKFVAVDLYSTTGFIDLDYLNSFYPVERLQASPETDDAGLAGLANLNQLRGLVLAECQLTDDGLAGVEGFTELQELSLASTPISDAGLTHLSKASGLKKLDLSRSQVRGEGLADLKGLTNLEVLNLSDTLVDDAALAQVAQLDKLRDLTLTRTRITSAGLVQLRELKRLERLDLDGTRTTDEGLAHLAGLDRLETLSLSRCQVTDQGLNVLKNLPALVNIHHDGTELTTSKIREIVANKKITRAEVAGAFKIEGEEYEQIYFGYAGQTRDGATIAGGVSIATPAAGKSEVSEETFLSIDTTLKWSKTTGTFSHSRLPLGRYVVYLRAGNFFDCRYIVVDGATHKIKKDFIVNAKQAATVEVSLNSDAGPLTFVPVQRDPKTGATNEDFPGACGVPVEVQDGKATLRLTTGQSGRYQFSAGSATKAVSFKAKEQVTVDLTQ